MKEFEFKATDWVLTRDLNDEKWQLNNFSHKKDEDEFPYHCAGQETGWKQCIPFNDETKHLLGTTEPYKPPYEPKDGDFMINKNSTYMFIYKAGDAFKTSGYAHLYETGEVSYGGAAFLDRIDMYRLATEEEKQKLLNALHEAGKDWDAKNKKIIDYKWKPKKGEQFYVPVYSASRMKFIINTYLFNEINSIDRICLEKGWIFKTLIQCQSFCDKLNEAIKNVK